MWHHENPDTQKKKELDVLKKCLAKEMGFRHTHTVLMYWQNRFFREKKKRKKTSCCSASLCFIVSKFCEPLGEKDLFPKRFDEEPEAVY